MESGSREQRQNDEDGADDDARRNVTGSDVLELLDTLVENDVDLDGDGIKDAASIGIRVTTIAAELATF